MEIPRELIINSDAADRFRCLFLERDCNKASPLTWKFYREDKEGPCPCKTCEFFAKFKEKDMTLMEFRDYVDKNWFAICVEHTFP